MLRIKIVFLALVFSCAGNAQTIDKSTSLVLSENQTVTLTPAVSNDYVAAS